jgi:diguanylate cyclase (GGDEF)-like protein
VKNSWIDELEIYIFHHNTLEREIKTGDKLPYSQRPLPQRFFAFDHQFKPGSTTLIMRLATPDAFIAPIYLTTPEQDNTQHVLAGYGHGLIYGVIAALLIYNLILGFSLNSKKYLLYSCYMGAFLAMNLTYTGHSYPIFWPDSPIIQGYSIPVLMTLHVICGLSFASSFLSIRTHSPNLYRAIRNGCLLMAASQLFAIAISNQNLAINLAFSFMMIGTLGMIAIGFISLRMGERIATYFLPACILGAGGAAITCMTVMGIIPFNPYSYAAVDVGMTMEAILFALALAKQMNQFKEDKLQAEKMARIDQLTGIDNRRGFFEQLPPIWNGIIRNKHTAAVIMIDIDHFKCINDNYGHHHGDDVLVKVSETLQALTRNSNLLARWGGEEFIVFLPETDMTKATLAAERYRQAIEELELNIEGENLYVTISLGISEKQHHESSIDDLIVTADNRLIEAKSHGRNCVYTGK